MNRGNNQQRIFPCDDDYRFYLEKLTDLKAEHSFELMHYCLMGTHTHMLVKINKETDFSVFSKRLNLSYANYYKRNYGLTGHLWQGRYKSQIISKDNYFMQCGKYIELNPVRAGTVEKPEDYEFSSYRHYACCENDSLITDDIFYSELGSNKKSRCKKYRALVISEHAKKSMSGKKIAIGSSNFVYNVNKKNKYHQDHDASHYRQSPG